MSMFYKIIYRYVYIINYMAPKIDSEMIDGIPLNKSILYHNKKIVLYGNTFKALHKEIDEKMKPPKKNMDVYIIRVGKSNSGDDYFYVQISKKYLTPDLELKSYLAKMNTFIYSKEDFNREGFNKEKLDKLVGIVNKGKKMGLINIKDIENKPKEEDLTKENKTYKEANIMKGRSDLKKNGDKITVDTELNIKKGLEPKIKRALKKSVEAELDKKISGSGFNRIRLDLSDSEDDIKGRGLISDSDESSSDEEDIKEYGKLLKHLISHITDPKEKIDKKDFKQSIELIKKIKSKKA